MRAPILATACLLLGIASAAAGSQPASLPAGAAEGPPLPLKMRPITPRAPPSDTYLPLHLDSNGMADDDPLKASTVAIGPFSARLGGTAKRANLARYRLEGANLLGGSVSGTLDTRGARVFLRWPPNDDE